MNKKFDIKHKLFVISAPSGAGKTTLVNQLIKEVNLIAPIEKVVTYTTKRPRITETDKKDYHFLSVPEFELKIEENFFLEWSKVYENYYGSPAHILENLQKSSFILIVDRLGAESLKKILNPKSASFIWIRVHNLEILRERLTLRSTENSEQIERRLKISLSEIEQEETNPIFEHHIYNEHFETAVEDLKNLLLSSLGD